MSYILLITENKTVSVSLKIILKEKFLVEEVLPGDALKSVAVRRPAVIFLDSQLGGVDSMEILTKLFEYDPGLTVIKLVSSFNKMARQSIEAGVFDVIEKPFDAEKIVHLVNRAIEREKLLDRKNRLSAKQPAAETGNAANGSENKESFFQELFQAITESFPDAGKTGIEVLKILKKRFYFNRMALFLKEKESFILSASVGIEEKILSEIKISCSHPVIMWFLSRNRILNLSMEEDVSFECRSFMEVLNCRVAFPLKTLNGNLIGVFLAGDKLTGRETTFADISFLSTIMDYLTTVFDNASLYREITFREDTQKAIFRNIPAGIIAVDRDGRIIIFNSYAETIFGLKAKDVIEKPVEKAGSQIADFIRRTLISGDVFNRMEINYIPGKIILGLSTNLIKDEEGMVKGAVAICQNLTFIKEIEKREKESERNNYWTALASRLSHELKNPLVAIKTFAQMLPLKYDDEEFRTSFSGVMQGEVQRINEIIDRINKLADSMELKPVAVDVVGLFHNKIKEVEKKNGVRFNLEGNDRIFIPADPEKLKEAVGYIFDFIYEDTAGAGEAHIRFDNTDKEVEITITENGNRISLDNAEDFFIPFNSVTRSPVSIGMMLARKIMESHGGSFRCIPAPSAKNLVITLPANGENG